MFVILASDTKKYQFSKKHFAQIITHQKPSATKKDSLLVNKGQGAAAKKALCYFKLWRSGLGPVSCWVGFPLRLQQALGEQLHD